MYPNCFALSASKVLYFYFSFNFPFVSIFFVSTDSSFGAGSGVAPYVCCDQEANTVGDPIVEYTFKILCACPMDARRKLRGQSEDPFEAWNQAIIRKEQ